MYRIAHVTALVVSLAMLPVGAGAQNRAAPRAAAEHLSCVATAEGVPSALLGRAARAMGMPSDGRVFRARAWRTTAMDFQSDRTYPPFFDAFQTVETWFDPRGGGLATRGRGSAFPRSEGGPSPIVQLSGTWAAWVQRDTTVFPGGTGADTRGLDPWAVVHDFLRSSDVTVDGRCSYRDYPRVALTRAGVYGPERLLLDPRTFVPVALVREEPHYLWGQVRTEYVWSNWDDVTGGARYPLSAFRRVDGAPNVSQTVTGMALIPADSAPRLALPDTSLRADAEQRVFARPQVPDTARVSPSTWLLVNPAYTITVTLQRDTVYVLDATLSEARARQDADWIARLFPGPHPVVLVVTDLAWPHIGGVRYWVASGATVVSHRASRAFLEQVVNRRWTRSPDLLEQRRARSRFVFRAVDDSLVLAGGDLVLHPIDGIASEGALVAWLPADRYLWASDYIQGIRQPSGYMREVRRAVQRAGLAPDRFAAQHTRLTAWRVVDSLLADEPAAPSRDVPEASRLVTGRLPRRASLTRNGVVEDRGERVQDLVRTRYHGRDALVSVQVFATPQGPATDSSIADPMTLAPIRHVGVHRSRTMVLDFQGARVTGRYEPENAPARPIDMPLDTRVYDSSLFDLVFAALPLREGYAARLPFYVYEQGGAPVWYDGRVTARERLALADGTTADTWVVDIAEDGRPRSRLHVTVGGSEVVRSVHYISPGVEYTITR